MWRRIRWCALLLLVVGLVATAALTSRRDESADTPASARRAFCNGLSGDYAKGLHIMTDPDTRNTEERRFIASLFSNYMYGSEFLDGSPQELDDEAHSVIAGVEDATDGEIDEEVRAQSLAAFRKLAARSGAWCTAD